ncbi:hypothetical protein A2380_01670 [candidate division WWE3 bacterium RIFOXYB1_FULL_43_24]|uniref:Uncharacterized protein n=2 Tax=Katanobacteria TaxID=422282 RepID=A0A0G0YN49_UNCKA|nr:MAG: hypothetical protein UU92_C0002G0008 [candidate division WWE3 bacterium GW2011_GWA1_42_12]KKS38059.1 MAG: hypothetical protein UV00_C0009G0008 [candidate division WWE3 bacterium GW2011_GWF1_42_14]KKS40373.1 MAG: hypothetical protein UV03_C0007G0008 [candidate division WWE3 bacterium GW2011_GWE1_42_16]KKS66572.1 MAG: hypothetical protein UV35_C0011G0005 [candidate division WWE3 bacterium GW2011_GWB1_42_6]OGC61170.1 MAG: hypothetical protein A2212_01425 [candidate division WWE3 bacterium 
MKSAGYYVKLGVLMLALFSETFFLTTLINGFVSKGDFFNISVPFSLQVVGIMTLIILTFALTIGAWDVWYFNIMTPLAIAAGIMVPLLSTSTTYALIIGGVAFILMAAESYRSYRIKRLLIKFEALLVLRFAVRGILLVFSILAGLIIILNASNVKEIDFGQLIAEVAEKPIKSTVNSQLQQTIERQTLYSGYSPEEVQKLLDEYGIEAGTGTETITNDLDIKSMIQTQVNDLIAPYKELVRPLIAILVFGLFQLYAAVSYAIYSLLVGLIIAIAKKTGLLKIVTETVEKQDLQF